MGPTQVVLLVAGILGLQVLIWIPLIILLRRRAARTLAALSADLAASGERVLRGPERASYSGSTGSDSIVGGSGVVALTERRLIFRKLVGAPVEVPVEQVLSVREDKWFNGQWTGGRLHTILTLQGRGEMGFMFRDPAGWAALLRGLPAVRAAG